jgi:hypothetical protein
MPFGHDLETTYAVNCLVRRFIVARSDKTIEALLADARKTKAVNDVRYRASTWVSYILYALGWSLGLAGRLVGVEGMGGAND